MKLVVMTFDHEQAEGSLLHVQSHWWSTGNIELRDQRVDHVAIH